MASNFETFARAYVAARRSGNSEGIEAAWKNLGEAYDSLLSDPEGDTAIREEAKALYENSSGDIEVDSDAIVSRGDDGAFVAAWVWVPSAASNEED